MYNCQNICMCMTIHIGIKYTYTCKDTDMHICVYTCILEYNYIHVCIRMYYIIFSGSSIGRGFARISEKLPSC